MHIDFIRDDGVMTLQYLRAGHLTGHVRQMHQGTVKPNDLSITHPWLATWVIKTILKFYQFLQLATIIATQTTFMILTQKKTICNFNKIIAGITEIK